MHPRVEAINMGNMLLSRIQVKGWHLKKQALGTTYMGKGGNQKNALHVCY
jgi:hypothetical protein